ncbi:hypothetical protein ACQP08_24740 [Micromonospora zamorensis]
MEKMLTKRRVVLAIGGALIAAGLTVIVAAIFVVPLGSSSAN